MMRLLITIIGFVIAGAVFMFYTKPAYDSVKVMQGEIAQYNLALERANELQALKQSLLSRYNAFNPEDIDRLHKLLPDHVDNVRLVLDLDNLASQYGLAMQNVVIGRAGDPGTQTVTGTIGKNAQAYDSLTFKFTTHGSYQSFMTFMESLERSLRIVDLVSLTVASSALVGGEYIYRYDVTIRTYWLK